jgi:glycosyltransferase involved in cell wall biosynthesis
MRPLPQASDRPLRIGVMLRGIREVDGVGVFIRQLCDALFEVDRVNQYVLFYMTEQQAGRYARVANATERVVRAPNKLVWDQVAVPLAARQEQLDVLFHHKFSIPLLAPCPTVVQQRGTEYWTFPEWYPGVGDRLNRLYNVLTIPLFCRTAARVLTNSDTLGRELETLAGVPRQKLATIYAAADARFTRVEDESRLRQVRERYQLPPEPFFLVVARGGARLEYAGETICPRKNVEGVLAAFGRVRQSVPQCPPLIVLGAGITERLPSSVLRRYVDPAAVRVVGLVDHADMPVFYSMAGALVFPSYYESFGIPLVEAMACGCPVITSNASSCPEVAGDAALIVPPDDVDGITSAMTRLLREPDLAESLRARGLRRARDFSWQRSAQLLLTELVRAARSVASPTPDPALASGAALRSRKVRAQSSASRSDQIR